jgi:hypothetical protein
MFKIRKKSEKYLFLLLYFSAEKIKFLSMILVFFKKFQKSRDKICPWPLSFSSSSCLGLLERKHTADLQCVCAGQVQHTAREEIPAELAVHQHV